MSLSTRSSSRQVRMRIAYFSRGTLPKKGVRKGTGGPSQSHLNDRLKGKKTPPVADLSFDMPTKTVNQSL